jgi:predicted MPP superfamily phosphohydrolase
MSIISGPLPAHNKPSSRTPVQSFKQDPATFLALWLYNQRPISPKEAETSQTHETQPTDDKIRIVCISDTHNTNPAVPDGDLLIHAGDLSNDGTFEEIQAQLSWLASLPHRHKIVIAGNHDRLLDAEFVREHPERISEGPGCARADLNWHDIVYLENSAVELSFPSRSGNDNIKHGRGDSSTSQASRAPNQTTLKIFGSPKTPSCGTSAFQYPPIRNVWQNKISSDADIVIVHGPPKGYLDESGPVLRHSGCPHLTRELERVRPKLVVFGHIHSAHGRQDVKWSSWLENGYARVMSVGEGDSLGLGTRWLIVVMMLLGLVAAWIETFLAKGIRSGGEHLAGARGTTTLLNAALGNDPGHDRKAIVIHI